jgi:hypothetical protein
MQHFSQLNQIKPELKSFSILVLTLFRLKTFSKNVAWKEPEPHKSFYPGPEPHKNDPTLLTAP